MWDENSKIKVYLIYLKGNTELYAFTITKEFKDKFLSERNRDKFIVVKDKMEPIDFSCFSNINYNKKLCEYPLSISRTEFLIIVATSEEENILMEEADKIDKRMDELYHELAVKLKLKDKYKDAVEYLCTTNFYVVSGEKKNNHSSMNMLFLFTRIFKNTFESEE